MVTMLQKIEFVGNIITSLQNNCLRIEIKTGYVTANNLPQETRTDVEFGTTMACVKGATIMLLSNVWVQKLLYFSQMSCDLLACKSSFLCGIFMFFVAWLDYGMEMRRL